MGSPISATKIRLAPGLITRMEDMEPPKSRQELRKMLGLFIQLMNYQHSQHKLLRRLQKFRTIEYAYFKCEEFKAILRKTVKQLVSHIWQLQSWEQGMKMELYIDANALVFGAIIIRDGKVLCMYSCGNPKMYQHSSVAEVEGFSRALRMLKPFFL